MAVAAAQRVPTNDNAAVFSQLLSERDARVNGRRGGRGGEVHRGTDGRDAGGKAGGDDRLLHSGRLRTSVSK